MGVVHIQMATPVPEGHCCAEASPGDVVTVVFCYPCVYGAALTKDSRYARNGETKAKSLCPDTSTEWLMVLGSCVFGAVVPCLTGIYLRSLSASAGRNPERLEVATIIECCALFTCGPCQINQYRKKGGELLMFV